MLIFCDGFDHYGLDETNMTDGAYAQVDSAALQWALSTTIPRTGTHNLRRGVSGLGQVRRVFPGGLETSVGQAAAVRFSNLPTSNNVYVLYDFRDTANAIQISLIVQSTGILSVKRGNMTSGVEIGVTLTPAVVAEAYQHIETFVTFNNTTGSIEVRVNGVTVISETGIDTVSSSNEEASQVALHCGHNITSATGHGVITDVDDYFCYDDSGSFNNTFIGDRRVLTLFPDADTAQADWTPLSGTGFSNIDEPDPDDDTTYISTAAGGSPNPVSEFSMENLPAGVSTISAVVIVNRMKKTEAGLANVLPSIVSGSSEAPGEDHPLTEAYAYYHEVIEADPDTSSPFTPSAVDSAKLKLERTQ